MMQAQIGKWGKSLGVRIPAAIGKELHFIVGERVNIRTDGNCLIIEPQAKTYRLKDLMRQCREPLNSGDAAYDWGEAKGNEVW